MALTTFAAEKIPAVRSPQTLSEAGRRVVAAWAADCADRVLGLFEANFRGDPNGSDIVVLSGVAEVDDAAPSAAQNALWVTKYAPQWSRAGMTAESFARRFSVPVRIRITRVDGF